tara:strand:+ start:201 stop:731 length:531 start_codon:yes stop_codon:yes gene_type:complete
MSNPQDSSMIKSITLDNIMPTEKNEKIIKNLCNVGWFLATEYTSPYKFLMQDNHLPAGFNYVTHKSAQDKDLNNFAEEVVSKTCEILKIKYKIDRIMWNMYLTGQNGTVHTDMHTYGYLSFLYNLHTTDGGTEIEDTFLIDKESQVKIFDSQTKHKGIGPKKDIIRFNLNVVINVL